MYLNKYELIVYAVLKKGLLNVSEILKLIEIKKVFLRLFFPFKRNLTNKPLAHFLNNPCLPTGRHYSIIPIVQL